MTTPKAKFAGLALITALLIVGLITPALAEHEVGTMDCSNPFADLIPIPPGTHPPKSWRCKEGTGPNLSGKWPKTAKPVFYEKADGASGKIQKGANTTCNVEPVEPKFWEGWRK